MAKLLLLSIIVATLAIPLLAARSRNPVRGMKLALVGSIAFYVFFLLAVRYVYPHLVSL